MNRANSSTAGGMLAARGLACYRGDRLLFRDLSISVGAGEALQVSGPNGSGKTTLLRILCGLTLPEEGEILWRGRPVDPRAPEYIREIHYVGHSDGVKLELTPLENLRVAHALAAAPRDVSIEAALERLGLGDLADVACRRLSAGQRRRVALARLLIGESALWILDEPFTSLDRTAMATLHALLTGHLAAGGGVLLTSHQPLLLEGRALRSIELQT